MNIENALRYIRPEPVFSGRLFTRDDYETGIIWDDARPKPTWAELLQADADMAEKKDAEETAKLVELVKEDELRTKYGLTTMKYASLEDLEAATKSVLAEVGGANKAIEMLAMAVALIDRRMTRRGL